MEAAIIDKFPLFENYKKKEKFFTVLGLLFSRQVTLAKAAELLEMSREEFSKILKLIGLEYSYLTREEAHHERTESERL
ncbi:MAG: UPF0175 family protein [Candidatus Hydrothermarchaeota archaeon]|nr:UPF0175 family protein [Candidatus Hydrothermarchaeota archaeon]